MKTTIGRIVLYTLSAMDAVEINRRRTTGPEIAKRIPSERWPLGAQAHIGNDAAAGQEYPAVVVRVFENDGCNLQVLLDGNDTFWATTRYPVTKGFPTDGYWRWPPRD